MSSASKLIMQNKLFLASVMLLFLASAAFAIQLNIVSPVKQTLVVKDDVLNLGVVGPGQTVEVVADRGSGVISEQSQTKGEALWDQILVERDSLPQGWSAEDSKLFEKTFHAFVTAAKDAPDGEYSFKVRAVDQYEGAGEKTFNVKVTVSKDVLEESVSTNSVSTGVGLPAAYQIKLKNKSSASDVFEINANGIPGSWKSPRRVFVKFNDEVTIQYEILPSDQGEFPISIDVVSLSSPLIASKSPARLQVYSSLEQDLRSLPKGILLFPTVEQVVYSTLSLISQIVYR